MPYLPLAARSPRSIPSRTPSSRTRPSATPPATTIACASPFISPRPVHCSAAGERATMLVIEDLHWIDDASLSLLRHLVAVVGEDGATERARLLIVLTTPRIRSVVTEREPRRSAPARAANPDHRPPHAHRAGESTADRRLVGSSPTRATVDRLYEATAGNPLVLRSALSRLRGLDTPISDSTLADLVGPTDLDHELSRRVEQLSTRAARCCPPVVLGEAPRSHSSPPRADRMPAALDDLIEKARIRYGCRRRAVLVRTPAAAPTRLSLACQRRTRRTSPPARRSARAGRGR